MDKRDEVFQILDNMLKKHGFAVVRTRLKDGLFSHDQERSAAARGWVLAQRLRMYGGFIAKLIGITAAIATIVSVFN
jgi:hypothetical protein